MTVDLAITPDVEELLRAVREWSVSEVRPLARRADSEGVYPSPEVAANVLASCPVDFCPMGFEELADSGRDKGWAALLDGGSNVLGCLVMEEMGYGDGWAWQVLPGGRLSERVIRKVGTPAQVERWVGGVERGQYRMTAIAMTEQEAGSDIARMQLSALSDGDSWVLNGTKRFISNGGLADYVLVFATVDPTLGHRGIRAFMVERGTPGFTVTEPALDKIGFRHTPQATLRFDEVRIPLDQCLGDPENAGRDTATALTEFNATRPYCVAWATGMARAALDVSWAWVQEHDGEYSSARLTQMGADRERMAAALDDGRRMILRAAWHRDQGLPNIVESSMAKAHVAPLVERVVLRSLQMMGPEACSERHLVEKWYRDAKLFDIVEGTGQILRITISRQQLGSGASRS
jgi:alkylation response protein AidB-like acyl-CoA dehydrogenase